MAPNKMSVEIEVKFQVPSHAPLRAKLQALGATCEGLTHETNTFFDTPTGTLVKSDKGLRIRLNRKPTGQTLVVTYKGPKQPGPFKNREEIEVTVDDHDALVTLFSRLGYDITLSFEKRRETWQLGPAEIVLDTLPHLGNFAEIEAPTESDISKLVTQLDLQALPPIKESYAQLLAAWVEKNSPTTRVVTF